MFIKPQAPNHPDQTTWLRWDGEKSWSSLSDLSTFFFFFDTGSHYIDYTDLEFNRDMLWYPSIGIKGSVHHAWPNHCLNAVIVGAQWY